MGYVARFPFGVTNGDGTMAAVSALSHEMFEGGRWENRFLRVLIGSDRNTIR